MPSLAWRQENFLLVVGLCIFGLDQLTKALASRYLSAEGLGLVGDLLRLTLITNTGGAFGLLPGRTPLFTAAALLAVPFFFYLGRYLADAWWLVRLSPGLLLGGTLGNLLDRVRLGYVVDFVDVGLGRLRWPAFNLADSAFVLGGLLLAGYLLLTPTKRQEDGTPRS